MHTPVTTQDIRDGITRLGIAGKPICLHASLRSFGCVAGGADAVIDGILDSGSTLLVPTFSSDAFAIRPPTSQLLPQNGWSDDEANQLPETSTHVYNTRTTMIDASMGAIPAAVIVRSHHRRGDHPLNSFGAIGPLAETLITEQSWTDVYAPLRELTKQEGFVLLAGVGLNRMTILHLAEALAGRRLSRRWALGSTGSPVAVPVGTCSEGFPNLEPYLGILASETHVANSHWHAFPAREVVATAAHVIRQQPEITRCADPACPRCPDAIAGGPILKN
jgi:aminoglycoside N3'-acetyltransferase